MNIENDFFKKYSPDFEKLRNFGFENQNEFLIFEKVFFDNQFKAVISINKEGKIESKIYDIQNNDEYLPIRKRNIQGEYVGLVKEKYEEILKEIRDKCYTKKYFIYPQTNRIASSIVKNYRDVPEFLWEKLSGTGVFRHKDAKKWYAIILDVDWSKIQKRKKGIIEVINLKLPEEKVEKLTKKENYFNAYHMNKKYWITIPLNGSIRDEEIIELIKESYNLTKK